MRQFAATALLLIAVISCSNVSTNTAMPSATPENSPDWWVSWLAQPVCKPPCWQNITPGITTFDEALSILKKTPGVTITYKSKNGLDWRWSKQEGGTLYASQEATVEGFWIANKLDNKLLFKTIVGTYGEPEYVKPYDCNVEIVMCSVALIYPNLGIVLSIYIENKGETAKTPEFELSPDNVIDRVYFLKTGIESIPNFYNLEESEVPIPWKGFGKYP